MRSVDCNEDGRKPQSISTHHPSSCRQAETSPFLFGPNEEGGLQSISDDTPDFHAYCSNVFCPFIQCPSQDCFAQTENLGYEWIVVQVISFACMLTIANQIPLGNNQMNHYESHTGLCEVWPQICTVPWRQKCYQQSAITLCFDFSLCAGGQIRPRCNRQR